MMYVKVTVKVTCEDDLRVHHVREDDGEDDVHAHDDREGDG